ncbi:MAG: hypothetical protein JW900_15525 [Anaerolineae bacterium]|nr:hypothetical protein [Anaerolineae bacterium]
MDVGRNLVPYLDWGMIACFALTAAAVALSLFYFFDRARRAPYYILREKARRRGQVWLTVALVSLLCGLGAMFLRAQSQGDEEMTPTPLPLTPLPLPPSPSSEPSATATRRSPPTQVPSPTSTRQPTATPSPMLSPTPAYPLPDEAVAILPGAVPADPEARITAVTLALDVANAQPVGVGTEFSPGDHRVYLFFSYRWMNEGSTWTYAWYREGEYLDGNTCLWGVVDELCPRIRGGTGTNYIYFKPPGGYVPGRYEVRVWIEDRLHAAEQFVIVEE